MWMSTTSALWPAAFNATANALLQDISGPYEVAGWTPGAFALWSRDAFPLVLSASGEHPTVVAAAPSAGPRVMAFAHEAMVADAVQDPADFDPSARTNIDLLVVNALRWLAWDRTGLRVGYIVTDPNRWAATGARLKTALMTLTPELPSNWAALTFATFPAASASIDVLIVDTYQYSMTSGQANAVLNWLRGPKRGMLVAGHAWNWGFSNANANIFTQLPINQLLWPYGIVLTKAYDFQFQDASAEARQRYPFFSGLTAAMTLFEQLSGDAHFPALTPEQKTAVYHGIYKFLAVLPRRTDVNVATMLGQIYAYLDIAQLSWPGWSSYAPAGAPTPPWNALNLTGAINDPLTAARAMYKVQQNAIMSRATQRTVLRKYGMSKFYLWGPFVWPIAFSEWNEVLGLASVPLTGGRVVAFGHNSVITDYKYPPPRTGEGTDMLVINSFRWLGWGQANIRICTADESKRGVLQKIALGVTTSTTPSTVVDTRLITLDTLSAGACEILYLDTSAALTPARINLIKSFLRAPRKGLMVAGQVGSYLDRYSPLNKPLTTAPINRLLWDLGFFAVASQYSNGPQPAPLLAEVLNGTWLYYNLWFSAMELIQNKYGGGTPIPSARYELISNQLSYFINTLPASTDPAAAPFALGPMFATLKAARRPATALMNPPSDDDWFYSANVFSASTGHPSEFIDIFMDAWAVRHNDIGDPARLSRYAAAFPGVPGAGATLRTIAISINATHIPMPNTQFRSAYDPLWRSTGAWFHPTPGQAATITVSANAVNKGLMVQIGSQTDDLNDYRAFKRVPVIFNRFPITSISRTIANPMGGLIYIVVPPGTNLGAVTVTLTNVIQAPRYVAGRTTLAQWNAMKAVPVPAPWTEFESRTLILQVPTKNAKTVADPAALMAHWDKVLDSMAWLSNMTRTRAERFTVDADITNGWMHAGYPIEGFVVPSVLNELLNTTWLQTYGAWGPYHELGHQHQWNAMEFTGTSEASVNLFTMNALNATGITAANNDRVDRNWLLPLRSCYFRNTPNPADLAGRTAPNWGFEWGTWVGLDLMLQLQENFGGWNFYRRVFADYVSSNKAFGWGDDVDRAQYYILTTSRLANYNLVPFFEIWGFPITAATRTAAAAYPEWTANPMLTWRPSATDPSCVGNMGRRRLASQ
ncbi:hypothetical protein HYH03_004968 [Edaphochlamys debaryana]|uniref:Peptidase M60 domain-containing protein n=1 Tax=Edaphochlamys debaryana TaxID=47281 RepID=A0A836C2M4_9CHLO|nr:hypothetical protein HYH03_004968 [Edaphochlamys debaryana]|eukprot:KAG2496962.1 hypothetical protein HYH03_004968 [Edaphochlamys debaryana]